MRELLVAGNWKMHGSNAMISAYKDEIHAVQGVAVVLLPPAGYIAHTARFAPVGTAVGAQDCHADATGAYTGDHGAEMLAELGATYCVVGHSERRQYYGETDEQVAAKLRAVVRAEMRPIVCVGETLAQREAGNAVATVRAQLATIAENVSHQELRQAMIAYEPVWAIGTGVTATPEQAEEMHAQIRELLAELDHGEATIAYGGSVNESNAADLFAGQNIDGALVGGASLDPKRLGAIAAALAAARQ